MQINTSMNKDGVLSPKDFVANLPALKTAAKQWHNLSHQMIVSACIHAHLFGDIRGITTVVSMMPTSAKTNSMRNFVLMFAPVKWSATTKKFKFQSDKAVKNIMEADSGHVDMLNEMFNKHWSSFGASEKASTFKPFDLQARLDRLMKDMNKALDDANTGAQETIKAADVNAVMALRKQLFGEAA